VSDEKLRELERRFRQTGSVEDEASWLRERVRVGELTQERVRRASALSPACRLALELPESQPLTLEGWSPAETARLGIALSWLVFPIYEEENQSSLRKPHLRVLLEKFDQFALKRVDHAELLESFEATVSEVYVSHPDYPEDWASLVVLQAVSCCLRSYPPFRETSVFDQLVDDGSLADRDVLLAVRYALAEDQPETDVVGRVATELVPWLLGYSDPVRMRVAKRGEVEILPEDLVP
jgi:hypothetical protein